MPETISRYLNRFMTSVNRSGLTLDVERLLQIVLTVALAAMVTLSFLAIEGPLAIIASALAAGGWLVAVTILGRRRKARLEREEIEALKVPKPARYTVEEFFMFASLIRPLCAGGEIDRASALDIDLAEFHEAANSTLSIPGEVMLFVLLTTPPADPAVARLRRDLIRSFKTEGDREQTGALFRLGREKYTDMTDLLFRRMPPEDPRFPFYLVQSIVTIGLTVMAISGFAQAVIPMVLMLAVNIITYQRSATVFSDLLPRLATLIRLVEAADTLSAQVRSTGFSSWSASERDPDKRPLLRAARFLVIRPDETGNLFGLLLMYLKVFLLLDALVYRRLLRKISGCSELLKSAYLYVGEIDALQAIGRFFASLPVRCDATILEGATAVEGLGVYHPLLSDAVANDIALRSPGVVLTGANMSGKSTFLRTIALNIVLARTVGLCAAASFRCSSFRVMTLIRKNDSLDDGTSLYLYEARRIFAMLEGERNEPGCPLFLAVDEFFSGTNSVERIAAAVAVLTHLASTGSVTIAATHDLEIANDLEQLYELRHFADRFEQGEIIFDYTIRPGTIGTTNALSLLRVIGYPEHIVALAESRSDRPRPKPSSPADQTNSESRSQ